jgi:hypothetical protein
MQMLGGRPGAGAPAGRAPAAQPAAPASTGSDQDFNDDIPF